MRFGSDAHRPRRLLFGGYNDGERRCVRERSDRSERVIRPHRVGNGQDLLLDDDGAVGDGRGRQPGVESAGNDLNDVENEVDRDGRVRGGVRRLCFYGFVFPGLDYGKILFARAGEMFPKPNGGNKGLHLAGFDVSGAVGHGNAGELKLGIADALVMGIGRPESFRDGPQCPRKPERHRGNDERQQQND